MAHWKVGAVPVVLLALGACTQKNPEYEAMSAPPPPPAAVLGPALDSVPLQAKLARMQGLLDEALSHGITGDGSSRIVAVKLLADRLLEVPPPFRWLKAGYSTEAKLRQIQSLSDRLLSELRREDADENVARADTRQLRASVAGLRAQLAQGGGAAPPSLDSLLAQIPRTEGVPQAGAADE